MGLFSMFWERGANARFFLRACFTSPRLRGEVGSHPQMRSGDDDVLVIPRLETTPRRGTGVLLQCVVPAKEFPELSRLPEAEQGWLRSNLRPARPIDERC